MPAKKKGKRTAVRSKQSTEKATAKVTKKATTEATAKADTTSPTAVEFKDEKGRQRREEYQMKGRTEMTEHVRPESFEPVPAEAVETFYRRQLQKALTRRTGFNALLGRLLWAFASVQYREKFGFNDDA